MKLFALALIALSLQATAVKQTLSGTFQASDGTGLNGRITFRLPVAAGLNVCSTAVSLQSNTLVTAKITNGVMTPTQLWPTDCMSPRVPYNVTLYDAFNNQLFSDNWFVPSTAGAVLDVGDFIDTKLAAAITVAVPNALNLNPAFSQSLTQPAGTSLTIHGTVIFDPPISGGGGSSFYQTVLANGTAARQRPFVNYVGAGGLVVSASDNGSDTTTLTFTGGGSGGGGGGAGYAFLLTSATSYTVAGTTHNLGTADLTVSCNDTSTPSHSFQPVYTINSSTFDVTMNLLVAKAGSTCFIK